MIKQVVLTILKENGFEGYGEINVNEKDSAIFIFHKTGSKYEFYIIVDMLQSEFVALDGNKLFSQINEAVKKSQFYVPEVDKNTSLIICVEKEPENKDEEILERKELEVEENPYFYKKYVLSYNGRLAKDIFEEYLSSYNSDSNITKLINNQINNPQKFIDFKLNAINNEDFGLLSKMVMKIPIIPVEIPDNHSIKSLSEIINETIISEELMEAETLVKFLSDDKTKENTLDQNITAIIDCWERSIINE